MSKRKCLFCIKGRCNSSYGNDMKCDGLKAPKKCPWKNSGSSAMAMRDNANKRIIKSKSVQKTSLEGNK